MAAPKTLASHCFSFIALSTVPSNILSDFALLILLRSLEAPLVRPHGCLSVMVSDGDSKKYWCSSPFLRPVLDRNCCLGRFCIFARWAYPASSGLEWDRRSTSPRMHTGHVLRKHAHRVAVSRPTTFGLPKSSARAESSRQVQWWLGKHSAMAAIFCGNWRNGPAVPWKSG